MRCEACSWGWMSSLAAVVSMIQRYEHHLPCEREPLQLRSHTNPKSKQYNEAIIGALDYNVVYISLSLASKWFNIVVFILPQTVDRCEDIVQLGPRRGTTRRVSMCSCVSSRWLTF